MEITPFLPSHLSELTLQPSQVWLTARAAMLVKELPENAVLDAWTVTDGSDVLACGGFIDQWEGRSIAWALIGGLRTTRWVPVFRRIRSELDRKQAQGVWRIEATCEPFFRPGRRMLQMLGFEFEGYMERYDPRGMDALLFARIDR